MHTASKKTMAPVRLDTCPNCQLLERGVSTPYIALQTKNSARSASVINRFTTEIVAIKCASQLSITGKKMALFSGMF